MDKYLFESDIYIVDTFSGTIVTGLNMGSSASTGIAFNATGTRAHIAVPPSDLFIYDTATLQFITDVKVGTQPVDVVLSPDGARIYVTSFGSSTISIVDAHTNQLLTNATAPATDQHAFSWAPLEPRSRILKSKRPAAKAVPNKDSLRFSLAPCASGPSRAVAEPAE